MQVEVRYFAAAREAAGTETEAVEVAEGATLASLLGTVVDRHADLADLAPVLRFAVGERFARTDETLTEGDVVALLPPVSGG